MIYKKINYPSSKAQNSKSYYSYSCLWLQSTHTAAWANASICSSTTCFLHYLILDLRLHISIIDSILPLSGRVLLIDNDSGLWGLSIKIVHIQGELIKILDWVFNHNRRGFLDILFLRFCRLCLGIWILRRLAFLDSLRLFILFSLNWITLFSFWELQIGLQGLRIWAWRIIL